MVSSSPLPGCAATEALPEPGMATPSGAWRRLLVPAFPARRDWYWYSRPEAPSLFQLTVPTTGRASWPSGWTRWGSGTRLIPTRFSLVTLAATVSDTRWAR